VVGGGPAGSAVALHLARLGVGVLVIERDDFPKDKCCGEGIMPHGVVELEGLGVLPAVMQAEAQQYDGITYLHGDIAVRGCFPGGEKGLGIRRLRLDAILHEAVVAEPGITTVKTRVDQVEVSDKAVAAITAERRWTARMLVAADGIHSRIRRQRGLEVTHNKLKRYGANYQVALPDGFAQLDKVEVHFSSGCELYLTPVAEHGLNIALLCEKKRAAALSGDKLAGMRRLVGACPSMPRSLVEAEPISPGLVVGPLRQTVKAVVADRTALVGDAAGFLDPITGEGLSVALISARLLAEHVAKLLPTDALTAADLAPYAQQRAGGIKHALALTELILWWVNQPLLPRYVVGNLARRPDVFETLLGVAAGSRGLTDLGLSELRDLALPF